MAKTKTSYSLKVVKRDRFPLYKSILLYVIAVLAALTIGAIVLSFMNVDFVYYYSSVFTIGLVGNRFWYKAVEGFIKIFVPLLITSLGLSLSFKMRFWNIGGEGQFIMGALSASFVAMIFPELPTPILLLSMFAVGAIAGALYGSIASFFKIKFGTNETLMTLMLNYIALYVLRFFGETKADWNILLREDSMRPVFQEFGKNAWMPTISLGKFSLNISLIIAILINVGIYFYIKKTKQGYEISVVGDSPNTARYAGMKVSAIIMRTMFISSLLIGLAGAFYVSSSHVPSTSVTNNVGWTGIIVAWLAKLHPAAIFVVSLLISILRYGCQAASASFSSLDVNFADLLQGLILFSVLATEFFMSFKIVLKKDVINETKEETK